MKSLKDFVKHFQKTFSKQFETKNLSYRKPHEDPKTHFESAYDMLMWRIFFCGLSR
jgi:hypothetical protein